MPSLPFADRPFLLLTLLCALLYLPGLASLPPLDRDEARFAQASKQMLEEGEWLVPHFQDQPRSKKPAGIYWLQATSVGVLSDAQARAIWAYRVPSAFGAWLSVLLTYAIGRRLFDPTTAVVGAALLASSLLLVAEAHLAKADAVLLATILMSIWGLTVADRTSSRSEADTLPADNPGPWPALAFWGGLGLGSLIKGPVGPAVVGLTVVGLRIGRGRWVSGRSLQLSWGVPLFLVLAGVWPAALAVSGDFGFLWASANEDLLPKLLSGQESHGAPPGTYLLALYPSFWPASLLVMPALVAGIARRHEPGVAFCLAWAIPAWALFALVPTKLPHYVLPVYPALALLCGAAVTQGWLVPRGRLQSGLLWLHYGLWTLFGLALAAAIGVLPWRFAEGGGWWSYPLALAVLLCVAVTAFFATRGQIRRAAAACVVSALVLFPWTGQVYAPRLDHLWVAREVAARIAAPADRPPLASTGYREPSLVFLGGTDTRMTTPEGVAKHLADHDRAPALVAGHQLERFNQAAATSGVRVERIARFPGFNYSNGDPLTVHLLRSVGDE